jgi:erythromycin esterase-like protein
MKIRRAWWVIGGLVLVLAAVVMQSRYPAGRGEQAEFASIVAHLTPADLVPTQDLPRMVEDFRIVLVGESHGFVEPLDLAKNLIQMTTPSRRFTCLACEQSVTDQPAIDRFLATDKWDSVAFVDQLANEYRGAPNLTREWLEMIPFVRSWNQQHPDRPLKYLAVDVPNPIRSTAEEARDQHMFNLIDRALQENPAGRVLVYCGSSHAYKKGAISYPDANGHTVWMPTLGALLRARYPGEVASICVLGPSDPLSKALAASGRTGPIAMRFSPTWVLSKQTLGNWRPGDTPSLDANDLFDYAVWFPTLHPGTHVYRPN